LGYSNEIVREFGWDFSNFKFTWEKMSEKIRNYIGSLNWSYKRQLVDAGIRYFHNYGYFIDEHTIGYLDKNSEKQITAQYIIISTGGRPFYGDTPGKELAISSDDIFRKKTSPGKTLVIGGGYVAVECAAFLHEMKLDMTLMNRSVILRKFDEQCAAQIGELMERSGIRIILKAKPISFCAKNENFPVIPEGSKKIIQGERKGQI
jgi:Pyruvate/2-oxoglutarate dehydrogenase complex, dihydrolipoamide dehydrogenase (E3) component, and related enzymes